MTIFLYVNLTGSRLSCPVLSCPQSILEMLQNEPVMAPFVPKFAGMVESDGKRYLKMQNLVALFPDANIMDIKMGLRTFVESEVNATALRKDLLKKMLDIDPEAASPAEVQNGITKMRYMQFRERQSSSYALGFRLEAMRVGNRANKGFKTLRARSDIVRNVEFFLDGHELVKRTFLDRLRKLRDALRASVFFHNHEVRLRLRAYAHVQPGSQMVLDRSWKNEERIEDRHQGPWRRLFGPQRAIREIDMWFEYASKGTVSSIKAPSRGS